MFSEMPFADFLRPIRGKGRSRRSWRLVRLNEPPGMALILLLGLAQLLDDGFQRADDLVLLDLRFCEAQS